MWLKKSIIVTDFYFNVFLLKNKFSNSIGKTLCTQIKLSWSQTLTTTLGLSIRSYNCSSRGHVTRRDDTTWPQYRPTHKQQRKRGRKITTKSERYGRRRKEKNGFTAEWLTDWQFWACNASFTLKAKSKIFWRCCWINTSQTDIP